MNNSESTSLETVSLSEIADVGTGSGIQKCKPDDKNPYHRTVLHYKGSSCTNALFGQMGAPFDAEVSAKFDSARSSNKPLASGDILIPRTFNLFGCGIYDGSYEECYANRALFVIRGNDLLTHEYLSVLFRTEAGEALVRESAAATKSFDMSTITLAKLKELKLPVVSEATMKSICANYQEKAQLFYKNPTRSPAGSLISGEKVSFLRNKVREQSLEIAALKLGLNETAKAEGQAEEKQLISLARNVDNFLKTAMDGGLVSVVNGSKVCIGNHHSVHVTKAGHSIVENMSTGGIFVYKKDGRKIDVVFAAGLDEADIRKFEMLSEMSAQDSFVEPIRTEHGLDM